MKVLLKHPDLHYCSMSLHVYWKFMYEENGKTANIWLLTPTFLLAVICFSTSDPMVGQNWTFKTANNKEKGFVFLKNKMCPTTVRSWVCSPWVWNESCMSFGIMLNITACRAQGQCLQKLNDIGSTARKPTALQKPWIRGLLIGSPSPWDGAQPADIFGSLCHIECRSFTYSNPSNFLLWHLD